MKRHLIPTAAAMIAALLCGLTLHAQEGDPQSANDSSEPDQVEQQRDSEGAFRRGDRDRDRFDRDRRDSDDIRRRRGSPRDRIDDSRPGVRERGADIQLVPPRDDRRDPRRRHWVLGIRGRYTQTGVRVTDIVDDSPAYEAGLEEGDLIVTVDGYQVGYVNGRLYSLSEEFARNAGPRGNVGLLVQNRRNGRLVNIDVRLERRWRR